jgi:hypothetical protein
MSESIILETAFKCDTCGKLFNSVDDAQIHNRNAHREGALSDDSDRGLWTSTPAEDVEEARAIDKLRLDKELQDWEVESTKEGQDSLGN